MIFSPFVSIPAEDDREDAPKTHLITGKDIKRFVFIVLPVMLFVLFFAYRFFKKQSDWAKCAANMNAVYKAINLYANDFDGRFPPLASANPNTGTPYVNNGLVNTWVTQVFPYDQRPDIYRCPAATDDECVPTEAAIHGKNGGKAQRITIYSSYGMYAPYASANSGLLDQSGQSILLGETSNNGAHSSYDPFPFKDASGKIVPFDGFLIGFDNSNTRPDALTKALTRMAFRNSANGNFASSTPRHEDHGLHAIATDGSLRNMNAGDTNLNMRGGEPTGIWRVPAAVP